MMNFTWKDEYSVFNPILDRQHQDLFQIFNSSYLVLKENKSSTETIMIIGQLTAYFIFHFNEEERLMREANYEDIENHILEHKYFISKIQDFKSHINDETEILNEEIFLFLFDWLVTHIGQSDQKYVPALKRQS